MIEANDFNFDEVVKEGITIVDFWAPWCGPCKSISPHIEAIDEQFEEYKVVKVNVDNAPVTTSKLGIRSIPTLMILEDGVMVDLRVGFSTATEIRKMLERFE